MKKYILPLLFAMFGFVPTTVLAASNLEVSNTADFSAQTLQFSRGDTIFVRLQSASLGNKKSLINLRDNQYDLINSFNLERDGAYYKAVFAAPYETGYYSLEAQIESESASATSVKTIKVGNPNGANVSVHVNNKTGGQSSQVLGKTESDNVDNVDKSTPPPSPEASTVDAAHGSNNESTNGVFRVVAVIVKEVIDFFWPFN